jgi:hypothetical protein
LPYFFENNSVKGLVFAAAATLLSGCFESAPPTDAEFHLACVRAITAVKKNNPSSIVPTCNCIIMQIQKSDDPAFALRIRHAFFDNLEAPLAIDAATKAYRNSFPENSAEYLIEQAKLDSFSSGLKTCIPKN